MRLVPFRRSPRSPGVCAVLQRGPLVPLRALPVAVALLAAASAGFAGAGIAAADEGEGSPPSAGDTWTAVDTGRFTVLGDTPDETLTTVAADLERLHHVLAEMAPVGSLESERPTLIYLFRAPESFAPFRTVAGGRPTAEPAYLLPRDHADYAALLVTASRRPSKLVHKQYIHRMLHRHLPGLPLWLRHGLAEFYATFEADRTEARLGLPPSAGSVSMVGAGSRVELPLAELLTAAELPGRSGLHGQLDRDRFFMRSWLVVHRLLAGDYEQRRRVVDYIQATRRGVDSIAAFSEAFGMTPEELDEELDGYPGAEGYTYLRIPVASPSEIPMEVRSLGPAEQAFRLGDLLLQLGPARQSAARERLERAVKLDPGLAGAWAGLGELAAARGEPAEAGRLLRRAAEAAPDDFRVQLAYGQTLLETVGGRRPRNEEEVAALDAAVAAFRRSVELRPESGAAWAGLGHAQVLAPSPDPEAAASMERAVELLPDRPDLVYNLVLARARAGDRPGVSAAIDRLAAVGAGDALLHRAREMELQLLLREAHRLARAERLDDAVALLAVVREATGDPAVAERAGSLLNRIARAAEHNRFVEVYSQAASLYRSGDLDGALAAVEELAAEASGERQEKAATDLRERIEMEKAEQADAPEVGGLPPGSRRP